MNVFDRIVLKRRMHGCSLTRDICPEMSNTLILTADCAIDVPPGWVFPPLQFTFLKKRLRSRRSNCFCD